MAYTPPPDGYTDPDPQETVRRGGHQAPDPTPPYIPYTYPYSTPVPNPYTDTNYGGSISEPTPRESTITSTILGQIIPMVYGPRRVVGQIAAWDYDSSTDTLILGVIFCYGEQDSVTGLKINNEAVADLDWVNDYGTHVGDGSTAIDSLLTGISVDDRSWSATDTATWQQYAHAVVSIDTANASSPGSFKIEAIMGGRKIAPVGGGAKTMSTNPVRVAYDIETDAVWKGLDSSKIHDTSWGTVRAWCDEVMEDSNTRYEYAGVITERNPDTAREMVLKHCLAYTYIDMDGKRRMWCEMLPGALSGTWTSGGTPTPSEDDFESYSAGALPTPFDWVAETSNVAWSIADDGSGSNNVLVGNPSTNAHGTCKWDELGEMGNVDVSARVKCPATNFARAGIFVRGSSFASGKPSNAILLFIRRSGTDSYTVYLQYFQGSYEKPIWSEVATGVADGDWVYLRLYINGTVLKAAWSEAGVPSTWNRELGHTEISADGYVGAYMYSPDGTNNGLFDDFYCGLDGSTAASTNDYLIALNADGAATTELTVGDTIIYKGQLTTVVDITDDDNIQIADEISGYETYIRGVEFLHLGVNDWVVNPSCSELNSLTVPDIIRASFTDGENFGAQTVEESYGAGTDKILEMSLPGCSKAETAGRVAKTNLLIQHLQPYTWQGIVGPEIGAQLEPGDVITFDTDLLTAQMGRVLPSVESNTDGTYSITLREYDPAAYSDEPGAAEAILAMSLAWFSGDIPPILEEYVGVDGAVLRNGTLGLTADWDAGGYEIRARTLEADVATGTAPLTIASTTVVANLNADLLDGNHASAFADAAHGHTGMLLANGTVPLTADWDAGGYEIRARTLESDVATGTAPLTIASTTVVSNLNADLLDGVHNSAMLHNNVAAEISALTSVHPAQTDSILINDASDSNNPKRVTYENLLKLDIFGKAIFIEVSNDSGGNMAKGDLCYISGDSSGVPQVTLADADAEASCTKMLVVLSEAINNGSDGTAIAFGVCDGFSGLTAGAIQYVHTTAGDFTETAPSGSGDIVRVAGYAISSTEIFLNPGHSWVEV